MLNSGRVVLLIDSFSAQARECASIQSISGFDDSLNKNCLVQKASFSCHAKPTGVAVLRGWCTGEAQYLQCTEQPNTKHQSYILL